MLFNHLNLTDAKQFLFIFGILFKYIIQFYKIQFFKHSETKKNSKVKLIISVNFKVWKKLPF